MARTHPEWITTTHGVKVPSPYIEQRSVGSWWCLACDCPLDNPQHLDKKSHRTKAWYWCFGCTDRGYEQRARAPNVRFDTRELTPKFWSNSPTDDDPAAGTMWATAAQQDDQQQQQPAAAVPSSRWSTAAQQPQQQQVQQQQASASDAGNDTPIAAQPPPGLQHRDTAAILAEIEKTAAEVANIKVAIATLSTDIATLRTDITTLSTDIKASISGFSSILNDMIPRGVSGVRGMSSSASAGALKTPSKPHRACPDT